MRQVIGILLDHKAYIGINRKQTGFECIEHYNQAADELGLIPFYLCLKHVSTHSALGLLYDDDRYSLKRLPIPHVIHNRAMTLSPYLQKKLQILTKKSQVFNGQNRYDKLDVHRMLHTRKRCAAYIPQAMAYSRTNAGKAMRLFSSFYVKPTNSSVGKGIMKVTQTPGKNWRVYWSNRAPKLLDKQRALDFMDAKVQDQTYLIQKTVSLAMYQGRPYDLRVTVQRGGKGQWGVTGIAGKVAANGRHVTNLAKGGEAMRYETLFLANGFDPVLTREQVEKAALKIAESLSTRIPSIADVGLDMGIDNWGKVWLIEVNCRDQRYQYKQLKLNKTFYRTYETPMRYAKYLLRK